MRSPVLFRQRRRKWWTKTFWIIIDETKTKMKIKTGDDRNRNQRYFSPDNIDKNIWSKVWHITLASVWQNNEGYLSWLTVLSSVFCTSGLLVLLELTHGASSYDWYLNWHFSTGVTIPWSMIQWYSQWSNDSVMLYCLNNNHYITKPNPNPNQTTTLTLPMVGSCIRYFWIIDHWITDHGIDIPL